MTVLSTLRVENASYTTLLLVPGQNLLFTGTDHGLVEVWDLADLTKRAELRYLVLNSFGEKIPVKDPVVALAAPTDFSLVYAFMGNAAYCIDVDLLTIIEKVPISEEVISGNIAPYSGDIGVITYPGYLSRWSPEFVERIASIDFPFHTPHCYLLHDLDETRVILIFDTGKLIVSALHDDPYTIELAFPAAADLVNGIWFDRNDQFQVVITDQGTIDIHDGNSDVPEIEENSILSLGKHKAEQIVQKYVDNQRIDEKDREYIKDFRLDRQSRDRYVAEVEKLHEDPHYSSSIMEDSKTLHFALNETRSDDIDEQTKAHSVIAKISDRHNLDPKFVYFARRQDIQPESIIEKARYFQFEAEYRQDRIYKIGLICVIFSFISLLLAELISFTVTSVIPYLTGIGILFLLIYYWSHINESPKIPYISEYRAIRVLCGLTIIGSLLLLYLNSFSVVLPIES